MFKIHLFLFLWVVHVFCSLFYLVVGCFFNRFGRTLSILRKFAFVILQVFAPASFIALLYLCSHCWLSFYFFPSPCFNIAYLWQLPFPFLELLAQTSKCIDLNFVCGPFDISSNSSVVLFAYSWFPILGTVCSLHIYLRCLGKWGISTSKAKP